VPQTRGVVRHVVSIAGNVVLEGDVAVKALVKRLLTKKRGRGRGGGDGAPAVPKESGQIVGGRVDGALAYVVAMGGRRIMQVGTHKFELGVVEGAGGAGHGDEATSHVGREAAAPEHGYRVLQAGRDRAAGRGEGCPARDGGGVR
jgi:hypothetical protein